HDPNVFFFFQAEDGIRDFHVTGVQTCALPIARTAASRLQGARACADRRARECAGAPRGSAGAGPARCGAGAPRGGAGGRADPRERCTGDRARGTDTEATARTPGAARTELPRAAGA